MMKWLTDLEVPGTNLDTFAVDDRGPRFLRDHDAKLKAAVSRIVERDTLIDMAITQATEERSMRGLTLSGRQALYLLYREYDMNPHMGVAYDLTDLVAVKFRGDHQLREFQMEWMRKVSGMSSKFIP
jgi:hypothetical protein